MSYDLTVLAADASGDDAQIRAMYDRCDNRSEPHPEGDLDDRIVAFYEELRARYPDHPPYNQESPWNSVPLGLGIDHVTMCIANGPRGDGAVALVTELARRHGLIIYDPQFSEVFRPDAKPAAAIASRRLRANGARGVPRGPRPTTSKDPPHLSRGEAEVLVPCTITSRRSCAS